VPGKGSCQACTAKLALRFAEAMFKPSEDEATATGYAVDVYACEVDYSVDVSSPLNGCF